MKDLDLTNANGSLNLEMRTDGGIGLYCEIDPKGAHCNTLMLSKEETLKMAAWLMQHIDENMRKGNK